MTRAGSIKDLILPWAGLIAGFVAWWLAHEFGYAATFDGCQNAAPGPVLAVTLVCVLVAIAGGWASWGILRGEDQGNARRVIAIISVGSAALFAFALLLSVAAVLILPPCFQ